MVTKIKKILLIIFLAPIAYFILYFIGFLSISIIAKFNSSKRPKVEIEQKISNYRFEVKLYQKENNNTMSSTSYIDYSDKYDSSETPKPLLGHFQVWTDFILNEDRSEKPLVILFSGKVTNLQFIDSNSVEIIIEGIGNSSVNNTYNDTLIFDLSKYEKPYWYDSEYSSGQQ